MTATGNAVANSYWEAKLSSNQKPHYESSDLEPFIRRKYCNKEFAEGTWPPALPDEAMPSATPARQAQRTSARPATDGASQPKLASDISAGRLEAGGFWGSLTPQESSVAADFLSDITPGTSLTPVRPAQQHLSQQLNIDSPALLIDLMDFGAESTFQLPTTPRRQTTPPGTAFGSMGGGGMPNGVLAGVSSNNRGGVGGGTGEQAVPNTNAGRQQGNARAVAATVPGLRKQQSSFPLLPPPPQVMQCSVITVSKAMRDSECSALQCTVLSCTQT